jgi:hypothetical protein
MPLSDQREVREHQQHGPAERIEDRPDNSDQTGTDDDHLDDDPQLLHGQRSFRFGGAFSGLTFR